MDFQKIFTPSKSWDIDAVVILGANLATVFGVIFYGWSLFSVLFLYWIESAIIGFFNIFKMLISPDFPKNSKILGNHKSGQTVFARSFIKIFYIPFFIVHYGMFMLGHLIFVYFVSFSPHIFKQSGNLTIETSLSSGVFLSFLMLFFSHGFSFLKNFIGKREYLKTSTAKLMVAPYKRIIIMHITLLFGGIFSIIVAAIAQFLNAGALLRIASKSIIISLFIILKIFADIWAHNKEHSFPNS